MNPNVLTETNQANKDKTVKALPKTVNPELQEGTQEEQQDQQLDRRKEEQKDNSVKGTVWQNCPRTHTQYVLHSQTPAECASVSALTGLTNGVPQKGLLQNKYKIRVDFKVSFCTSIGWHSCIPLIGMFKKN